MTQPGGLNPDQEPTLDPQRSVPLNPGQWAIPSRVGKYQVKRVIGAGSFGTVYEAIQDQPRRAVALKLLRPMPESGERFRRFRVEAEVLGRLHHPGIAQVFEAGVHTGPGFAPGTVLPFIAMELLVGARSLTDFCDQHQLDTPARVALFTQVCTALEHAHAMGVIHRDLKPSNILVEAGGPGQSPRARLIDFGVARWLDNSEEFTSGTLPEQIVGTVAYMSPEQCAGAEVDRASDQYALGVVLYQLLTGALPHDVAGRSLADATSAIRDQPPTRPTRHAPDLPRDLEYIILKALHTEPSRRYESVAHLREDLERWQGGQPIHARPAGASYVARRKLGLAVRAQRGLFAALLILAASSFAIVASNLAFRPGSSLQRAYGHFLAAIPPAGAPAIAELRDVSVIGFADATDMPAAARALGIQGVDNAVPKTFRALHGALMQHLVGCGARVVFFDIAFAGPQNGMEPAFVAGVKALHADGADVVVVMPTWHIGPGGEIKLDPTIAASGVRYGISTGNFHTSSLWSADAFMRRSGLQPVPNLVVAAYAAFRAPRIAPAYIAQENSLEIAYPGAASASFWLSPLARKPDHLPLAGIVRRQKPNPELGVEADDQAGQFVAFIPPESTLAPAVIDYAAALSMTRQELRSRVAGKAVLIANMRSDIDRKQRPSSGETISGALINAALLQTLLGGNVYSTPGAPWYHLLVIVPALLGMLLARAAPRRVHCLPGLLILTAALVGVSFALYRWNAQVWNPAPAIIALVLTALVTTLVAPSLRRAQTTTHQSRGSLT